MNTENLKPIAELSFEEAMTELESVVRRLDSGNIKLEDAVQTYERGVQLKNHCAEKLQSAKSKIDLLILKNDTPIGTENFENQING